MVGGIFCDLEKSFYCIKHKILLPKLEFHNIKEKLSYGFNHTSETDFKGS
jgi:hypothetical protein